MMLLGSDGLILINSSAWRRNVQSWFTRTLPSVLRARQPSVPWVIFNCWMSVPEAASASSSRKPWSTTKRAADNEPPEIPGSVRITLPVFRTAGLILPSAAFLMTPSCADTPTGVTTRPPRSPIAAIAAAARLTPAERSFTYAGPPFPCIRAAVGSGRGPGYQEDAAQIVKILIVVEATGLQALEPRRLGVVAIGAVAVTV